MANTYDQRILGAEQQAATARKLREGYKSPEGQMVSGWYVAPSPTQQIAELLKVYMGKKGEESAMGQVEALQGQKQAAIADALRKVQGGVAPAEYAQTQLPTDAAVAQQANFGVMNNPQSAFPNPQQISGGQYIPPAPRDQQDAAMMQLAQLDPQTAQLAATLRAQSMSEEEKRAARDEQRRQFDETKNMQWRIAQGGWDNAARVAGMKQPTDAMGNPIPKLTEGQAKATTYGSQMQGASNQLDKIEAAGFDPLSMKAQAQVGMAGGMTNMLAPAQAQQYKQAQEQWAESFLRAKTGAAATADEVALNRKTFFPQLGDSAEVVAQKRAARAQAENDVLNMAGAGREMATARVPVKPDGGAHPQDSEAVKWARANPNDPRSAAILRVNGGQ